MEAGIDRLGWQVAGPVPVVAVGEVLVGIARVVPAMSARRRSGRGSTGGAAHQEGRDHHQGGGMGPAVVHPGSLVLWAASGRADHRLSNTAEQAQSWRRCHRRGRHRGGAAGAWRGLGRVQRRQQRAGAMVRQHRGVRASGVLVEGAHGDGPLALADRALVLASPAGVVDRGHHAEVAAVRTPRRRPEVGSLPGLVVGQDRDQVADLGLEGGSGGLVVECGGCGPSAVNLALARCWSYLIVGAPLQIATAGARLAPSAHVEGLFGPLRGRTASPTAPRIAGSRPASARGCRGRRTSGRAPSSRRCRRPGRRSDRAAEPAARPRSR